MLRLSSSGRTQECRIELVNRSKVGYRVAECFRLYYVRGHNKKKEQHSTGVIPLFNPKTSTNI